MDAAGGLSVRFGKHWSADVAGLLDYRLEDGVLVVMLDYSVLRAAHKDQSVATCAWALNGQQYQTTMVTVLPTGGVMRVTAREEVMSQQCREPFVSGIERAQWLAANCQLCARRPCDMLRALDDAEHGDGLVSVEIAARLRITDTAEWLRYGCPELEARDE